MKRNQFVFAVCLFFLTAGIYAAEKSQGAKEIWVSPEKKGTLVTTNGEGWVGLDFGNEVDFTGYRYFQVEVSSPDFKKCPMLVIDANCNPDEDDEFDWQKTSQVRIFGVTKKLETYQGPVFGNGRAYNHWENEKLYMRLPSQAKTNRLNIMSRDENWKVIPNIRVFVKKVTATNTPLGKSYTINFDRYLALAEKNKWDDGSIHYVYFRELEKELNPLPKKGDVISIKLKGYSPYDFGKFSAQICDNSAGWVEMAQSYDSKGFKKGQKVDETIDFVLEKDSQKPCLEIYSYEGETTGPYIIVFD